MTIDKAFNKSAYYYDDWVKKAIPCFNEVFSIATEVISFPKESKIRVLDLGAGTGLFSKFVFEKYPNAKFVLYDVADKILKVAKERFKNDLSHFDFIVDDYKNLKAKNIGKFDIVISSLSIHHLENFEKKKLFKDSFDVLSERGLFLNLDQIKGKTDFLQKLYWDKWLEKTRKNGGTEEQIRASIQRREAYAKLSNIIIKTYWEIGKKIVEFEQGGKMRAEYGKKLLADLSKDLKRSHGKGFPEAIFNT